MNYDRTINSGDHYVLNLDNPNLGWRTAASMPNPRNHLGGVALDGKVYAIGGQQFEEGYAIIQSEVDVYDPATDKWKVVAPLPKARSQMNSGTFVMDGRIFVTGGEDIAPNGYVNDVTAYDPITNIWTTLNPLPAPRRSGVADAIGSEIIYATGWADGPGQSNTIWSGLTVNPTIDKVVPIVELNTTYFSTAETTKLVTLTYTDNVAIDVTDLNNSDIRITGPNGFNQLATFVSVDTNTNGTPRTANYQIVGTGGGWDNADNGLYSVLMEPNQVSDTSNNNFVASGLIGIISVDIPVLNALRIEAESMNLSLPPNAPPGSTPFRIEATKLTQFSSGGKLISLKNGGVDEIGFATYTFPDNLPSTNKYDVIVGYYDENDGVAQLEVKQGNTVLVSWLLNQNLGNADPVPQTFVRRKVAAAISILPGTLFQIKGIENLAEKARIDYLEFIPV